MNDNHTITVYGAGKRAETALATLKARGLEPRCFCDSDREKWGTLRHGLPVMGIDEALAKYSSLNVYVSPAPPVKFDIIRQLEADGRLSPEQILNHEIDAADGATEYVSCFELESRMIVETNHLYWCCNITDLRNTHVTFPYDADSIESVLNKLMRARKQVIRRNQIPGCTTPCSGCSELKPGKWHSDGRIRSLSLSMVAPCNLSCIYCRVYHPTFGEFADSGKAITPVKVIRCLEENDWISPDAVILLASGELAINPWRRELMELLVSGSGYSTQLLTNCVNYDQQIAELASRPGSFINVSLDCGTRETFYKVKGKDVFDRVVANIARYRRNGANMILKYILVDENCNQSDVDGFLCIAGENDIRNIHIVRNVHTRHEDITDAVVATARNFLEKAERLNAFVEILHFPDDVMLEIRR